MQINFPPRQTLFFVNKMATKILKQTSRGYFSRKNKQEIDGNHADWANERQMLVDLCGIFEDQYP